MLTLWKTLVLPIVEYCLVLWCPTEVGHAQQIESLQWSFFRKIYGCRSSYWESLPQYNIYSLQRCRVQPNYIYMENTRRPVPEHLNHRWKKMCSSPQQKFHFTVVKCAGSSPSNLQSKTLQRTQSAVSVNKFNRSVDMFLHTVPDKPQIVGYSAMRRATTNSINQMINFCNPAFQVMEDRGLKAGERTNR